MNDHSIGVGIIVGIIITIAFAIYEYIEEQTGER